MHCHYLYTVAASAFRHGDVVAARFEARKECVDAQLARRGIRRLRQPAHVFELFCAVTEILRLQRAVAQHRVDHRARAVQGRERAVAFHPAVKGCKFFCYPVGKRRSVAFAAAAEGERAVGAEGDLYAGEFLLRKAADGRQHCRSERDILFAVIYVRQYVYDLLYFGAAAHIAALRARNGQPRRRERTVYARRGGIVALARKYADVPRLHRAHRARLKVVKSAFKLTAHHVQHGEPFTRGRGLFEIFFLYRIDAVRLRPLPFFAAEDVDVRAAAPLWIPAAAEHHRILFVVYAARVGAHQARKCRVDGSYVRGSTAEVVRKDKRTALRGKFLRFTREVHRL